MGDYAQLGAGLNQAQAANQRAIGQAYQTGGLLSDMSERRRSECLSLAVGVLGDRSGTGEDIVKLAGAFYDFVTGKTTVERVNEALEKSGI